jgi:rubrerythrin
VEFQRTRDVIDHVRAFHAQVGELYRRLAEGADRERVRLLLNYMGRHEKHLEASLAAFEEQAASGLLDTWFQYDPEEETLARLTDVAVDPGMGVDDVIALAMRVDDGLIGLYEELAACALSADVKELFANLLELEKQEKSKAIRGALEMKDL